MNHSARSPAGPATLASLFLPLLGLAACGHSSAPQAPPGGVAADDWAVFDAAPSGRANQATLEKGEWVATDEVHFARGANADGLYHEQYYAPGGVPPEPQPAPVEDDDVYRHATWGAFGADRAPHNGDYLLPTDTARWPDFTADLGFLRLEATRSDLYLQLRFVSFPDPDAQIATITFSTATQAPAFRPWPRNAGVGSTHAQALTLWGSDGALTDAQGEERLLSALGGATRISDHAFEARVPLDALPDGPWRISAGAGLADPADPSRYWTVPAGAPTATTPGTDDASAPGANVWDLMFTPHDPRYHDDHIQADLLRDGDVSAAAIEVDPVLLQARETRPAPVITGRINHTYQSAFDFGDGIVRGSPATPPVPPPPVPAGVRPRDPAVSYEYTGALQPYLAYIPTAYPQSEHDWPLLLYFHGLNNYAWEPFGLTLGLEDELEARGYLFASLLGRGDISFSGRGELDPLEVIAHMQARYRIDPQRIYLIGHSHGAGGVLNVAQRNPDRFAGVVAAQIVQDLVQPANLRHSPTIHIAGEQDPIDTGTSARSRYQAVSALGYESQLLIYLMKTHENSSIHDYLAAIFDLFDRTTMPENPATVDYTRSGGDFDEALGLLHDRAWWVSGLEAVDPAQDMRIVAESFALPQQRLVPQSAIRTADAPVDTMGPSGRSLGLLSTTTPGFAPAPAAEPRATLTLGNVAALTLDLARMALDPAAPDARLEFSLTAATRLRLKGIDGATLDYVLLDAADAPIASGRATRGDEVFEIELPATTRTLRFGT